MTENQFILSNESRDQATGLRALLKEATRGPKRESSMRAALSIGFCSGKGGVGKSQLILNLAVALQEGGARVLLIDAQPGLGHLDLLCRRNGYWNLSHVMSGARRLNEILLPGPAGIDLLPGGDALTGLGSLAGRARESIVHRLSHLEKSYDFILIDIGGSLGDPLSLVRHCDQVVVVTTVEPTAITSAYATIKALSGYSRPLLSVLVNQFNDLNTAKRVAEQVVATSRTFLRRSVRVYRPIPYDPAVIQAAHRRMSFVLEQPRSIASMEIRALARDVGISTASHTKGYFESLNESLPRGEGEELAAA